MVHESLIQFRYFWCINFNTNYSKSPNFLRADERHSKQNLIQHKPVHFFFILHMLRCMFKLFFQIKHYFTGRSPEEGSHHAVW